MIKAIRGLKNWNLFKSSEYEKADFERATLLLKLSEVPPKEQKVLCLHCGRTASNAIRCIGKCVEDTEY